MKKTVYLALPLTLLIFVFACDDASKMIHELSMPTFDEEITMMLPPGFVQTSEYKDIETGDLTVLYGLTSQTEGEYTDLIAERYVNTNSSAEDYYRLMEAEFSSYCTVISFMEPEVVEKDGFTALQAMIGCGTVPDSKNGEVRYYFIAKGWNGIHLLSRTAKTPHFEQDNPLNAGMMDRWHSFFDSVALCRVNLAADKECIEFQGLFHRD